MNKRIQLLPLVLLCLSWPIRLNGQTATHTPVNFAVWLSAEGNNPLRETSPWRLVTQATAKRSKGITDAQAYLLRGGLGYEFNGHQQVSAGFATEYHVPYDSASKPYKWADYRIVEEAKFPTVFAGGTKKIKQRFRLEERWQQQKSPPDLDKVTSYKFTTLFRYQFRFEHHQSDRSYSILYDEIRLRLTPTNERLFAQNRLFGGIGFSIDREKETHLEIGYMLQTVLNSDETAQRLKRVNHVLRITLISDAPLKFN
jgi:Protein of unknown function (DUF2490)